jgi:hypothetical protein
MTEIEVLSPEDDLVDVGILAGALQRLDRDIFASADHEPVPGERRLLSRPSASLGIDA